LHESNLNCTGLLVNYCDAEDEDEKRVVSDAIIEKTRDYVCVRLDAFLACRPVPCDVMPFTEAAEQAIIQSLNDWNGKGSISFEMFLTPVLNKAFNSVLPNLSNEDLLLIHKNTGNTFRRKDIPGIIIEKNDEFIHWCLHRFSSGINMSNTTDDFMQEGRTVMFEKMREWDKEKGKFITYIYPHLIHTFGQVIRLNNGMTTHEYNQINKYNKVKKEFDASDKPYDMIEICERMDIGLGALNKIMSDIKKMSHAVYLDDPDNKVFVNVENVSPEDEYIRSELGTSIRRALKHIMEHGGDEGVLIANIVKWSAGLDGQEPLSYQKIAKKIKSNNATVSRLRNKGLEMLRESPYLAQYGQNGIRISSLEDFANNIVLSFISPAKAMGYMSDIANAELDEDCDVEIVGARVESGVSSPFVEADIAFG